MTYFICLICWLRFVWKKTLVTNWRFHWIVYIVDMDMIFLFACMICCLTLFKLDMVIIWCVCGLLQMHWSLGQIPDPYSQARHPQLAFIHECFCGYCFPPIVVHFSLVMNACSWYGNCWYVQHPFVSNLNVVPWPYCMNEAELCYFLPSVWEIYRSFISFLKQIFGCALFFI